MPNEILSIFMNLLMAALLFATIIYCLKLNRRIKVLQDSKSELARIIREFDESTQRATHNINEIHAATMRISENMQLKIDKANYLANDLEVMIEKGNKLAGKVDQSPIRPSRSEAPVQAASSRSIADILPGRSPEAARTAESAAPEGERRPLRARSRAEQELLNMLGGNKRKG